jgi:uncharacterized protein (DUF1697 family)
MKYVALLRGINVGGNNRVEMKKLKLTFEGLGFENVKSFINSGNVIFSSDEINEQKLTQKIEAAIKEDFGIEVKVLLRNLEQIKKLVQDIPETWVNNSEMKCDAMFLWPEIDKKEVLKELPFNPELEDVKYVPGAVLWKIDREKASKSKMFKIVGTKVFKQMTVRNPNTVRKIYELMRSS